MSTATASPVECYCEKRAVLRMSWTDDNPGRRFHSCVDYKRGGCKFFAWEDPPVCDRARVVVPGLIRNIRRLEGQIRNMEAEMEELRRGMKKGQIAVRVCWFLVTLIVIVVAGGFAPGNNKGNGKKVELKFLPMGV